jgi:hypothetical protein
MTALEPTYAALWAIVSALPAFPYTTRRPVVPANLSDGQFPALLMDQGDIDIVNDGSGQGGILTMPVNLMIYTNTGADPNVVPVSAANALLDQVRAAIWPSVPGFKQTLGGLAQSVFVSGKVEVFEGNQGQHCIVILPVTILCAEH